MNLAMVAQPPKPLPVLQRPRVRADCVDGVRPCPWVSCEHHLYLSVDGRGRIRVPHVDAYGGTLGVHQIGETCSLDVATEARTIAEVARAMGEPRQTIRQTEERVLRKLRASWLLAEIAED